MPLIDITRPDVIKFLVESYDKTARLRMKWNSLHQEQLQQAATITGEGKGYYELDVYKKAMEFGMPAITRDHVSAGYNRRIKPPYDAPHVIAIGDLRKGHSIAEVGLGDPKEDPRLARPDNDLSFDPTMRPVDPEQRSLLYKGIPDYGRPAYLKVRNKIAPEDKYYFQECGGWEYGWRVKDSYFGRHSPAYGRVYRMTHGSKSRTGPQPDPPHYKSSEIPGPTKCLTD